MAIPFAMKQWPYRKCDFSFRELTGRSRETSGRSQLRLIETLFRDPSEKYVNVEACNNRVSTKLERTLYSQTCIKRSPLGQRKSSLLKQVTF